MDRRLGARVVWLRRATWLVALGLATACGGEAGTESEPDEAVVDVATAEGQAQDTAAETARRFLPDVMRRSTRAETFAHDAHAEIDCATCHQVAEGHGSHGSVECADCHRASAAATVRTLSPADCQACHHGTQQAWGCERCHETQGAVQSTQELAFEVWPTPRSRVLTFEHGRHAALECASCHRAAPELTPAEACASCHEDHHTETIRCADCHTPAPEEAHDVESHLTCSGSGCHRARDIEAIADTPAVCLACHQAQEEHEPEGDCVECHRVRPGLGGRLGP